MNLYLFFYKLIWVVLKFTPLRIRSYVLDRIIDLRLIKKLKGDQR